MALPADVKRALDRAFAPRAVAVIGASANPVKFGYKVVEHLLKGGFTGRIYPINPKAEAVCGLPAFPSLASTHGPVDLAALLVPAEQTLEALRQCAQHGVSAAVVIASGFAEAGEAGARSQEEMVAVARAAGMRLIGPNCEGLVNFRVNFILSFSMMFLDQTPGPISFISQSGAYCGIVSSRLSRAGVGAAKVVSSGNEGDLAAVDYLEYLAEDPDTRVILAHVEGIREPRRFARVIGEIAARKPVVINKTGRTETGRRQAVSHTGALAGNDRVLGALLRQRGVVLTRHMDELVDSGLALASHPPLSGNRVAVLSIAGGLAVEMADLLGEAGFSIPPLARDSQEALRGHVPWFGTATNPVDFTGALMGEPRAIGGCLEIVLADPAIDAVAFCLTAVGDPEFSRAVHARVLESTKPVLICWTAGRERAGEALEYFTARRVPVYESTASLVRGLSALREYWRFRLRGEFREEAGASPPPTPPEPLTSSPLPRGKRQGEGDRTLAAARAEGRKALTEVEAAALLARYGIPTCPSRLASSPAELDAALRAVEPPWALKIVSPEIQHKTEVGGVMLGVRSVEEAQEAFRSLLERVAPARPGVRIQGVLVQPQVEGAVARSSPRRRGGTGRRGRLAFTSRLGPRRRGRRGRREPSAGAPRGPGRRRGGRPRDAARRAAGLTNFFSRS